MIHESNQFLKRTIGTVNNNDIGSVILYVRQYVNLVFSEIEHKSNKKLQHKRNLKSLHQLVIKK